MTKITVRRVSLAIDTHSIVPTTNNARAHSQARNRPSPMVQVQAAMGQNLNLPSSRRLSAGAQPQSPNHPYQRRQFELYQGESQLRSLTSLSGGEATLDESSGLALTMH